MTGFLVQEKKECEVCHKVFVDTIQSAQLKCERCDRTYTLCPTHRNIRCECGGKLLDAWLYAQRNLGVKVLY